MYKRQELGEPLFAHTFIQELLCDRPFITKIEATQSVTNTRDSKIRTTKTTAGKKLIFEKLIRRYPGKLEYNPTLPVTFYNVVFEIVSKMEAKVISSQEVQPSSSYQAFSCKCITCRQETTILGMACDTSCQEALHAAPLYNQWDEPTELLERTLIHRNYSLVKLLPIVGITEEDKKTLLDAVDSNDLTTVRVMVDVHPNSQKVYRYLIMYALVEKNIDFLAALTDIDDSNMQAIHSFVDNHPNKKEIYMLLFSHALEKNNRVAINWMVTNISEFGFTQRAERVSSADFFKLLFSCDRLKIKSIADSCYIGNELIYYGLNAILSRILHLNLSESDTQNLKDSLKQIYEKTDKSTYSPLETMVLLVKKYMRHPSSSLEKGYGSSRQNETSWQRIKSSKLLSYIFADEVELYKQRSQRVE